MSWFRVDDSFTDHPKVKSIPRGERRAAVGLWTLAGSYAARQLTDGFIFTDDVIDLGCSRKDAAALVRSALWHAHGHGCDRCPPVAVDQYLYHDWLIYQRSREQVLAERAKSAERQKKARDRAAQSQEQSRRDERRNNTVTGAVTHSEVAPLVTVPPTRPDPLTTKDQDLGGERQETFQPPNATQHPPDEDPHTAPSEARCTAHRGITEPPPCAGCRNARERAERRAESAADRERRATEDAIRDCPDCGGTGWLEQPDTGKPAGKCTHSKARRSA